MGMPRDYYTDEYGEPSLHSLHGSRPYVERDVLADMAHDQLPTLSTIGAGPQGAGVVPVPVIGEHGSYRFQLVSDETGEALMTSDNLHPGEISVWSPGHEWVAGEAETVYIRVRRGDEVDEYPVEVPPGAVGSRWFLGPEREYSPYNVYYFQVGDLQYDGLNAYRDKPVPRPNDLCAFPTERHELALGNVDACENGSVVVVARSYIQLPVPEIGGNGTWVIDGVDTGLPSKGDRGDDGLNAVVRIGNVEALPPGKASATIDVDAESNVYTLNLGIPEGAAGRAIDLQGGIWTVDTLPDYDETALNMAFIVYDGDKQFDLYIRGRIPVTASDGGPWTVVEDWQGRPGTGAHMLLEPYILDKEIGGVLRVPAAELSLAFAPCDYMADGDLVIDTEMSIGVLGSTEDDSGDYTVETKGTITARWENVEEKPFDTVLEGDGLVVTEVSMDGEALGKVLNIDADSLDPRWDMVREKPATYPAKVNPDDELLTIDEEGVLHSENVTWSMVDGKPDNLGEFVEARKLWVEDGSLKMTLVSNMIADGARVTVAQEDNGYYITARAVVEFDGSEYARMVSVALADDPAGTAFDPSLDSTVLVRGWRFEDGLPDGFSTNVACSLVLPGKSASGDGELFKMVFDSEEEMDAYFAPETVQPVSNFPVATGSSGTTYYKVSSGCPLTGGMGLWYNGQVIGKKGDGEFKYCGSFISSTIYSDNNAAATALNKSTYSGKYALAHVTGDKFYGGYINTVGSSTPNFDYQNMAYGNLTTLAGSTESMYFDILTSDIPKAHPYQLTGRGIYGWNSSGKLPKTNVYTYGTGEFYPLEFVFDVDGNIRGAVKPSSGSLTLVPTTSTVVIFDTDDEASSYLYGNIGHFAISKESFSLMREISDESGNYSSKKIANCWGPFASLDDVKPWYEAGDVVGWASLPKIEMGPGKVAEDGYYLAGQKIFKYEGGAKSLYADLSDKAISTEYVRSLFEK